MIAYACALYGCIPQLKQIFICCTNDYNINRSIVLKNIMSKCRKMFFVMKYNSNLVVYSLLLLIHYIIFYHNLYRCTITNTLIYYIFMTIDYKCYTYTDIIYM